MPSFVEDSTRAALERGADDKLVSGQWSVVSGQWSVVSGQRSVVSDQWSVISGQWSVVSGQWSVISGQWSRQVSSMWLPLFKRTCN